MGTLLGELCKRDSLVQEDQTQGAFSWRISPFSPRRKKASQAKVLENLMFDEEDDDAYEDAYQDRMAGRSGSLSALSSPSPGVKTPYGTPSAAGSGSGSGSGSQPVASPSPMRKHTLDASGRAGSIHDKSRRLTKQRHLGKEYRQQASKPHYTQSQQALHDYVGSEARELGGVSFTRFMNDLYTRVFHLVNSNEPAERLGGVRAIDALIDVSLLGENATKISRFANYLRDVFQPSTDAVTLAAAAKALGHLVHSGGK